MNPAKQTDDYDSPWKEAIETYFEECLEFFFPQAAVDIDWQSGYKFLDKELQKVVRKAETGRRSVDKLVEVRQKSGNSAWVLIHLDVQSQGKSDFAERMYIYNYRLFDRYKRRVASFAILADENPNWRPDSYEYSLWGSRVLLEFPTTKLLDYWEKWDKLEQSDNPFSILVMAHLHTQATRKKPVERYELKWTLTRRLYERGYTKQNVQMLYRFIDWLMALPPALEQQFEDNLVEYEEKRKMTYITSIERSGIEKGIQQGITQGIQQGITQGALQKGRAVVIQVLQIRFGALPPKLVETIKHIEDSNYLDTLHVKAITVESLEAFELLLNETE